MNGMYSGTRGRTEKNVFQYIDKPLLFSILILMALGWLSIYSAVYDDSHTSIFDLSQNYGKQGLWIGTSFLLLIVILSLDFKIFKSFGTIIYIFNILLLILVLLIGKEVKGSHSWLQIGSFGLQPAEFAKFGTALALANLLDEKDFLSKGLYTRIMAGLIVCLPALLIIASKETGSALVFSAFIFVLYREGLSGNYLLFGALSILVVVLALLFKEIVLISILAGAALLYILSARRKKQAIFRAIPLLILSIGMVVSVDYAFNNILQPHQKQRINVLLGKEQDLKGAGYNVHQSLIAIGSGGFSGKGFLEGTQTKFNFVPEQSTDFIFCTIGEELGFLGSLLVLGLFSFIIYRVLFISERQPTRFGRIYGYAVASIIFFHVMVNIGMTIGLLPVIGIPLPFVSYGGSSMWAFIILMGIFMRIDGVRKVVLH